MQFKITKLLAAAALAGALMPVEAAPVRWSVNGLTLTDGSTLSGGFTYDAPTNSMSDIEILLDDPPPGTPYTLSNRIFSNSHWAGTRFYFTQTTAANYTGQATLWFWLSAPLTDAGGFAAINTAQNWGWGICSTANCNSASTLGSLRGSLQSVPSPGTLALVSLGLVAALGVRRRAR